MAPAKRGFGPIGDVIMRAEDYAVASRKTDDIYDRYLSTLSNAERVELIERLASELGVSMRLNGSAPRPGKHRSLRELRGLGKEIWQGIDPDRYIDELRDDWGSR